MRALAALFVLVVVVASTGLSLQAQTRGVEAQTREFLDAYARGDKASVLGQVDRKAVAIYGSDAAEVFHGASGVENMIANDMKLWGGAATIGAMEHVSVVERKGLAAIFFDAPFSAGGRPPIPVRFAMVWRRAGKGWRLVQSSNVVPTQGQSAEALLRGAATK